MQSSACLDRPRIESCRSAAQQQQGSKFKAQVKREQLHRQNRQLYDKNQSESIVVEVVSVHTPKLTIKEFVNLMIYDLLSVAATVRLHMNVIK